MPNKFQFLYFNKIIAVIRSCKNEEQLENVYMWFNRVVITNKLPSHFTPSIIKTYRAKKQQIKNGLAAKYNQHWAGNSKAVPRPNRPARFSDSSLLGQENQSSLENARPRF